MSATGVFRQWAEAISSKVPHGIGFPNNTYVLKPETDDKGELHIGDGSKDMDFKIFLGSTTETFLFDVGNSKIVSTVPLDLGVSGLGVDLQFFGDTVGPDLLWVQSADALIFADNATLAIGSGSQFTFSTVTSTLTVLATDNDLINWGSGTVGIDQRWYGPIATTSIFLDASAGSIALVGAMRTKGFNTCSPRFELHWVAGRRGKPGIAADHQSSTESVRMITDGEFEIDADATSETSALCTHNVEGGITITTAGSDGDSMIVTPHTASNTSAWFTTTWGTDKETIYECHIKTGASIASCIIWVGLKLTFTPVTATDSSQVFFRYEDDVNSGKWEAISSQNSGTDRVTDTGITVATTTEYHIKFVILSDRTCEMYINGVLEDTSLALDDTVDLIPFIGIEEDGASAAKALDIYSQAISRLAG